MTALRTGKILIMVGFVVHLFTCAYWYIKNNNATSPEEVESFLSDRKIEVRLQPFYPLPTVGPSH